MTNEASNTENLVNKAAVAAGVIPAPTKDEPAKPVTKKASTKASKPAAKKDVKPASKKIAKADAKPAPKKETKPAAKKAAKPTSEKESKAASKPAAKTTTKATDSQPREGSKKAIVLDLLRRKDGATMAEIAKATDWQNHSIRGFISGNVTKKMGLKVESTKNESGERVYRIASK